MRRTGDGRAVVRTAILLASGLSAIPAAAPAQEVGQCVDGSAWWQAGAFAGLGPCQSPEEGFFVLACPDGPVTLDVDSPFEAEPDEPVTVTLDVDGRTFEAQGRAVLFARTDTVGAGEAEMPPEAVQALVAGSEAAFVLPSETRAIHLTGSGAAIRAMLANCGG